MVGSSQAPEPAVDFESEQLLFRPVVRVQLPDESSAIYPDETQASTEVFPRAAMSYYARLGIQFKAVLTDNGPENCDQSWPRIAAYDSLHLGSQARSSC